ncbi:MAG: ankyrin repeat domain-containing protein [Vicinamibacteria bacterium]|nr:ankyrin repeat domain-containing protein [Vicinamibacteria bacterium]
MAHTHRLFPFALVSALVLTACRPAPSTPLTSAALRGDVAQVKTLLATTSADTSADGWSPLIWAARAGRVEVMTLLLDAGADPNRPDHRQGWTPLMHALHKQQGAAARLLLARGADGARGAGGISPLEMAALDNDPDLLNLLLASPPSGDQRRKAFDLAVSGGALADIDRPLLGSCHTETVRLLLASDRSLAHAGEGLGSPLWWARRQGCQEVIAMVAAANTANLAQKTP